MDIIEFSVFYEDYTSEWLFSEIITEEDARELIWHSRFQGKLFLRARIANLSVFTHTRAVLKYARVKPVGVKQKYVLERYSKPQNVFATMGQSIVLYH